MVALVEGGRSVDEPDCRNLPPESQTLTVEPPDLNSSNVKVAVRICGWEVRLAGCSKYSVEYEANASCDVQAQPVRAGAASTCQVVVSCLTTLGRRHQELPREEWLVFIEQSRRLEYGRQRRRIRLSFKIASVLEITTSGAGSHGAGDSASED